MRTIIFTGSLVLAVLCCQAQACIQVDRSFTSAYPPGCLHLFADTTNRLTIDQLQLNQFGLATEDHPNFGTDGITHWLTFTCQNTDNLPQQLAVEIDIVYADEMSFYVIADNKVVQRIEHDSWHVPLWERKIPSRYFVFPLDLQPHQSVRIYLRAQERSGTLVTPIKLWKRSLYEYHASVETIALVLPATILLLLAVVGLILFLVTRQTIWLFYGGYALGTAIYNLNIEGFLAHYALAPFNQIKGYAVGVSFGWIANLLFNQQYVYKRLKPPVPWLFRANYGAILVQFSWLLLLILLPFHDRLADIALLLTGLTTSFIFVTLLVCLVKGSDEARFYLIAVTPFLVIILIRVLDSADLIGTQEWHYYARYYVPLFEIIVLGVGTIRQLIRDREATLNQLDQAQKEIITAQETERQRLAADLHDDVGTSLAALRGQLGTNETAQQMLDKIIDDVRTVSHNLMPIEFHDLGLADALQELAQRLETNSGIRFLFIQSGDFVSLLPTAELITYRLVQELMHNIVRHSQATASFVQLIYHETYLNVTVEDNGKGFEPKRVRTQTGIGLKNVYSRAEWLGSQIAIDSGPAGTTIRIDIPYPSNPNGFLSKNTRSVS